MEKPCVKGWASKVLDDIWLGSAKDASNLLRLQEAGITHILNVADDVENYFIHMTDTFTYRGLKVKDFGADQGISRVFPEAFEFVRAARERNGTLLVHCYAGQNRSVTVVLAILIEFENMTLIQAYNHLNTIRPGICPFEDNRHQIVEWERQQRGTNTMSVDDFLNVKNWRDPEDL